MKREYYVEKYIVNKVKQRKEYAFRAVLNKDDDNYIENLIIMHHEVNANSICISTLYILACYSTQKTCISLQNGYFKK